jgi:hypothetical protein
LLLCFFASLLLCFFASLLLASSLFLFVSKRTGDSQSATVPPIQSDPTHLPYRPPCPPAPADQFQASASTSSAVPPARASSLTRHLRTSRPGSARTTAMSSRCSTRCRRRGTSA